MEGGGWVRGKLIGNGSFGSVSIATERFGGGVFAVKSVSSRCCEVASLEKEIEILKEVKSPFVVGYLGDDMSVEVNCGKFRNLHMEFVSGGTVAELAGKRGGLEEKEIRGYARCLTRALHYLHAELGVIHCDVKGRNLLAGSSPARGKLADFGSAVRISEVNKEGNLIGGTPFWMAPEVARGEKPSTGSDVWSLACTIIEMATGSHPWKEFGTVQSDISSFLFRIGFGEITPNFPTKLSNDGKDFLDKCLRIDPKDRWSCEKLLRHPFIADISDDDSMEPSPRCVLDWDENQESETDETEAEFINTFNFCREEVEFEEEFLEFAKLRVSEMASFSCEEKLEFEWDSDDEWETVRWDPLCQKSTIPQFSDFTWAESEMSQTSGSDQIFVSQNFIEVSYNGSEEGYEMTRYSEGSREGDEEASGGCCNSNCGECFYYDYSFSFSFSFGFGLGEGGFEECQGFTVRRKDCYHWRLLLVLLLIYLSMYCCYHLLLFGLLLWRLLIMNGIYLDILIYFFCYGFYFVVVLVGIGLKLTVLILACFAFICEQIVFANCCHTKSDVNSLN